jgi:hypothetical protein
LAYADLKKPLDIFFAIRLATTLAHGASDIHLVVGACEESTEPTM